MLSALLAIVEKLSNHKTAYDVARLHALEQTVVLCFMGIIPIIPSPLNWNGCALNATEKSRAFLLVKETETQFYEKI